jgi:1,4-dihydroxy-2-naphthoate octaprenyltransferase
VGRLIIWLKALRAPFFTASAMSVVAGAGVVAWTGSTRLTAGGATVNVAAFVITLVGVVALHAGANLTNDYFDHLSGNDAGNLYFNQFSGGSRVIQEGLIPARKILRAAVTAFVIAFLCGAALWVDRGGWAMPVLGFAGLFGGYLYTAPTIKLAYRGAGEAVVGLTFGPLVTMGTYSVQRFSVTWEAFWCGVPIGILVALILLVNEFPDYEADKAAGKRTLIVRLGRTAGVPLCAALYAAVYGCTIYLAAAGRMPKGALWTLVTLPGAAFVVAWMWRHRYSPRQLVASSAAGVLTHLAYAVVLSAAYFLSAR